MATELTIHDRRNLSRGQRNLPGEYRATSRRNPQYIIAALLALFFVLAIAGMLVYFSSRPHFTIAGKGDSLNAHLRNYRESIDVAERFGLPIYKVIGEEKIPIKPAEARALEGETDRIMVLVPVHEGDEIDLRWRGHFTPASRSKG